MVNYCAECGEAVDADEDTCLSCGASIGTGDAATSEKADQSRPSGAKYAYRLAYLNAIFAIFFGAGFIFMLLNPYTLTTTQQSGGASLMQIVTFGPVELAIVATVTTLYAASAVGIWAGRRFGWVAGVTVNLGVLALGLLPPPTWLFVLGSGLGLYWGYRSRGHVTKLQSVPKPVLDERPPESTPKATELTPVTSATDGGRPAPSRSTGGAGSKGSTGSVWSAIVWMSLLSVLLFWLPALGPLIAGYVGGQKAGGVFAGVLAAVFPAVFVGGAIWFLLIIVDLPIIGAVAGGLITLLLVAHSFGVLVGAIIGGALG